MAFPVNAAPSGRVAVVLAVPFAGKAPVARVALARAVRLANAVAVAVAGTSLDLAAVALELVCAGTGAFRFVAKAAVLASAAATFQFALCSFVRLVAFTVSA